MTIEQFIKEHGLTAETQRVPENPNSESEWAKDALHFHVTLVGKDKRRIMTFYYSVGSAHPEMWAKESSNHTARHFAKIAREYPRTVDGVDATKKLRALYPGPDLADMLDCLTSDASSIDNTHNFEEWAGELGFDEDSRKAERSYQATMTQSVALCNVLGRDAYSDLLDNVERL